MTKDVQDRMTAVGNAVTAFHRAVYTDRDVDAALELVTDDVVLENVPSGSAASGREALRDYLRDLVQPSDLEFRRVSRTVDRWRVADEHLVAFTHDRELPWLLPGRPATGRRVEVLAISVVAVPRGGLLIGSHRTLWDQLTLLTQLGLGSARREPPPEHVLPPRPPT